MSTWKAWQLAFARLAVASKAALPSFGEQSCPPARATGRQPFKSGFILLSVSLVVAASGCFQPETPASPSSELKDTKLQADDASINDFASADWAQVYRAADMLERQSERSLPRLVQLLDRDEHVKLQNTADLIYPGAATFYGHGSFINYDLDWLPVRAGWIIEKISFQDFGFSEEAISEDKLLSAAISGHRDVPLEDVVDLNADASLRLAHRSQAAAKAREWWGQQGDSWNRLTALTDALRSENSKRVHSALAWLRFGKDGIDGFTREFYITNVYPRVQQLAESQDQSVSEQAQLLVGNYQNDQWYWFELKVP